MLQQQHFQRSLTSIKAAAQGPRLGTWWWAGQRCSPTTYVLITGFDTELLSSQKHRPIQSWLR
jgi:hypothetical protein